MPDFLRRHIKKANQSFPNAHLFGGRLAQQPCSLEWAATVYIHFFGEVFV